MKRPEQLIQRAVFQHLRLRGSSGIFAFHCPNGGWRSPIEGAIFKSLGVVAGVPDVLVLRDAQLFALELKAEGGRTTPIQVEVQECMSASGAIVGVAVGIDEALRWLTEHNLLRMQRT